MLKTAINFKSGLRDAYAPLLLQMYFGWALATLHPAFKLKQSRSEISKKRTVLIQVNI